MIFQALGALVYQTFVADQAVVDHAVAIRHLRSSHS